MLEIFVSNGLDLGKKGTSLFVIFASIMFLLAVLVLISMLSGPISKKDKKEGITHLIFAFLLFLAMSFSAYKTHQVENYYARIAKFDNLSQHYNVKKDGKILNFTRKGNDTNLMKAATVVIVNENDKEYHVNYNEAIYVVPKKRCKGMNFILHKQKHITKTKHILNECAFLYEIERPIIKGT